MDVADDCFLWLWISYVMTAMTMPTNTLSYQVQHIAANGSDGILWASGLAISQRGGATRICVDPFNANKTCVGLGSFAANTGNEPPPPHPALAMCLNPKP